MKKPIIILATMLLFAAILVSCERTANIDADHNATLKSVTASAISGILIEGNPVCDETGLNFKIEGPFTDGTIEIPIEDQTLTLTISDEGRNLAWVLSHGKYCIDNIVVKGGPDAFVYNYDGSINSDSNLKSPSLKSGKTPEISHLCFGFGDCNNSTDIIVIKALFYTPYTCETGTCWEYGAVTIAGDEYPFTECYPTMGIVPSDVYKTYHLINYFGDHESLGSLNVNYDGSYLNMVLSLTNSNSLFYKIIYYVGPVDVLGTCPDYAYDWNSIDVDPASNSTTISVSR